MTEEQTKPYQLTGQYAATAEFMYSGLRLLIGKYTDPADFALKTSLDAASYQHLRFMQSVFMRCQMQDEAIAAENAAAESATKTDAQ